MVTLYFRRSSRISPILLTGNEMIWKSDNIFPLRLLLEVLNDDAFSSSLTLAALAAKEAERMRENAKFILLPWISQPVWSVTIWGSRNPWVNNCLLWCSVHVGLCISCTTNKKSPNSPLPLAMCPEVLRSALLGPLSAVSRSSSLTVRSNTGPIGCSDSAGELKKCHCNRLSLYPMIFSIRRSFWGLKNCHCS